MILLLLAATLAAPSTALVVRFEQDAGRVVLRLSHPGGSPVVEVRREGDEVLMIVDDQPGDLPPPPTVEPPLTGVRFERRDGKIVVRIGVAASVSYEIHRGTEDVAVAFGPPPPAKPSSDLAELYRSILPVSLVGAAETGVGVVGEAGAAPGEAAKEEGGGLTLGIGQLTVRPWISAAYADAQIIAPDGTVQSEQYLEVAPQVRPTLSLFDGALRASYEPRFRAGARLPQLNRTSHFFSASLALPLGPRFEIQGSDDYGRGIVETSVADPGREYFSGVSRFVHNDARLGVRGELGVNLSLNLEGNLGSLRFREESQFFDYDSRGLGAHLSRELSPTLRLGAGLQYAEISAPGRKVAESQALTAEVQVQGDLAPLTSGSITLGYTRQENPSAPAEGQRYRGLSGSVGVQRALGHASNLRLEGQRATHASGFQKDGFFVTTAGEMELVFPLPFLFSFRAGAGYHLNEYRVPLESLSSVPREDRITMWSLGLSRPIRRWGFVRADYQRQRRSSNVEAFDHTLHALVIRVGLGSVGGGAQP